MDLTQLFDLNYLFDPRPGDFRFMAFFVGLFLVIIVGSFYLDMWIRKHPRRTTLTHLLPNIGGRFRLLGIVGFVFLWIRYENLPYLSIRFFFLAFLLYLIWVMGHSVMKMRTRFETTMEIHQERQAQNKYLPRAKKRGKKRR